jgi:uncharacterized Zn finger protein (UPF0148 family)
MGFTKYSEGHVRHVMDSDEETAATRKVFRALDGRCPDCGSPLVPSDDGPDSCPECEIPAPPASETN